jgi:methyl-accepting chemotaxis protein
MADGIAASAREVSTAAVGTLKQVDRAATEVTPDALAMVSELRRAAENLRRASEALARDPSIMVYGQPPGRPGPGE